ncbi:MAG: UvrD-helicase domain-containing protein [Spirochaetaceae bacterium]|jgi:ATP-dependent helicase/nuclease subunit A|nr:UvrD-helicase domain-containing protein [Spirochaetaceae bacterium]
MSNKISFEQLRDGYVDTQGKKHHGLDEYQKATLKMHNLVVTAGAGSGKTSTLAARYCWLVVKQGIPVDEILTLTFTKKAAAEMYSRIYKELSGLIEPAAENACNSFDKAHIGTFDSFCGEVARIAAPHYGLTSEFANDDGSAIRDYARAQAVPFLLAHTNNSAINAIMLEKGLMTAANELFADPAIKYGSLARPLTMEQAEEDLQKQKADIIEHATSIIESIIGNVGIMKENFAGIPADKTGNKGSYGENIRPVINNPSPQVFTLTFEDIKKKADDFINALSFCNKASLQYAKKDDASVTVKGAHSEIKNILFPSLMNIFNVMYQWDDICDIVYRIVEFQNKINDYKKESGTLSFNDIADIALDALIHYDDIQQMFSKSFRAIMIDEFQDDNKLQKDIIKLLCKKADGTYASDKVFFVGDEKQSIYRFRGADVSVFKSLKDDELMDKDSECSLETNYRSEPPLIEAFNKIFPDVFMPHADDYQNFEAQYPEKGVALPEDTNVSPSPVPLMHFAIYEKPKTDSSNDDYDGDNNDNENESDYEYEAAYIAKKIIEVKARSADIKFSDFAVLQKTLTHQRSLEKYFRLGDIPFNSERPKSLFFDGPANDIMSVIKLIVYPDDRFSQAVFLRSPFSTSDDITFAKELMTDRRPSLSKPHTDKPDLINEPPLITEVRTFASTHTIAELVSWLWYEKGYRYETVYQAHLQNFSSLYDLLFGIATEADSRGLSLSGFIDLIEDYKSRDGNAEKELDLSLPPDPEMGEAAKDAVQLMTVHKSKGLEFPFVFIYGGDIGQQGNSSRDSSATVYKSKDYGLTINLKAAEGLPTGEDYPRNYFYKLAEDENKLQEEAELRRLFYVAMTRAKREVWLTANFKRSSEDPFKEEPGKVKTIRSFLRLLGKPGIINMQPNKEKTPNELNCGTVESLYTIEAIEQDILIKVDTTKVESDIIIPLDGKLEMAKTQYAASNIFKNPAQQVIIKSVSHLQEDEQKDNTSIQDIATLEKPPETPADIIIRKAGLTPGDFGTIVHACIEAYFRGQVEVEIPPRISAKLSKENENTILEEAYKMRDRFLASELGQKAQNADWRETEFPIVYYDDNVDIDGKQYPHRIINGTIDLLFRHEGIIYIVDYKTDSVKNPDDHKQQLEIYRKAVEAIYKTDNVRAFLFYLRFDTDNFKEIIPKLV